MGFSLSEMQAWDQRGRQKTKAEQLNEFLGAVTQGMKDRRARDMENQKLTIEAGKSGYTHVEKQGGLGGILKGLMSSGAPKYEYTGVPTTELDKAKTAYYNAAAQGKLAGGGVGQDKVMTMADQIAKAMNGGDEEYDFETLQRAMILAQGMAQGQLPLGQGLPQGYQMQNGVQTSQPTQPTNTGTIRVRDKASGQTGTLPDNEFDPSKYERI